LKDYRVRIASVALLAILFEGKCPTHKLIRETLELGCGAGKQSQKGNFCLPIPSHWNRISSPFMRDCLGLPPVRFRLLRKSLLPDSFYPLNLFLKKRRMDF
jgi:hypothetical protein